MADERIEVEIVLDDGSIVKGFQRVRKQGKKTSEGLTRGFSKVGASILAVGAALTTVFAGRKVIAAAQQQEDAVNELNTALIATGKFSKETSQELQNFASELQRNSTIGDETTLSTAALIQSLGDLEKDGLKRATQAAATCW